MLFYSWPGAKKFCIGEKSESYGKHPMSYWWYDVEIPYIYVNYEEGHAKAYLHCKGVGREDKDTLLKIVDLGDEYLYEEPVVKFKKGPGFENALWWIDAWGNQGQDYNCDWYYDTKAPSATPSAAPSVSKSPSAAPTRIVETIDDLKAAIDAADDESEPAEILIAPGTIVLDENIDVTGKFFSMKCTGETGECIFETNGNHFKTDGAQQASSVSSAEFIGISFKGVATATGRGTASASLKVSEIWDDKFA